MAKPARATFRSCVQYAVVLVCASMPAACLPLPTNESHPASPSLGRHLLGALLSQVSLGEEPDLRAIDHPDMKLTRNGWISVHQQYINGAEQPPSYPIQPPATAAPSQEKPSARAQGASQLAQKTELSGEISEVGVLKQLAALAHSKERLTVLVQKSGDGGSGTVVLIIAVVVGITGACVLGYALFVYIRIKHKKDHLHRRHIDELKDTSRLKKGTDVHHQIHGAGRVIEHDFDDVRGKPYHVRFVNGEVHCYSEESARKLHERHKRRAGSLADSLHHLEDMHTLKHETSKQHENFKHAVLREEGSSLWTKLRVASTFVFSAKPSKQPHSPTLRQSSRGLQPPRPSKSSPTSSFGPLLEDAAQPLMESTDAGTVENSDEVSPSALPVPDDAQIDDEENCHEAPDPIRRP